MIINRNIRHCFCIFRQPYLTAKHVEFRGKRIWTLNKYSTTVRKDTFTGEPDRFKGIIVDTNKEKCDLQSFDKKLEDSLKKWSADGNRCIWFRVCITDAGQVPILAQKGFNFHHARNEFVMMYKWLPKDSTPNLPPASHTNLGVGAMVFNKDQKLLAVSEHSLQYPHWKLPGGYVDGGEDIIKAGIREVKEETGIDCKFESLVTFRHTHDMAFGNSDIYVLMRMSALNENITISDREIRACKWMDVEEYTNHPDVHQFNRFIVKKALEYKNKNIKLDFQKRTVHWWKFTRDMHFMILEDLK